MTIGYTHFLKYHLIQTITTMKKEDLMTMLEKYRAEHRFSQEEMAHLIGTSQPTYCRWIGNGNIAQKCYHAIAKLFGLPLRDIWPIETYEEED